MDFRITGLDPTAFAPLFTQRTEALRANGILRQKVTTCPGTPDRISLTDLPVGASTLLLNHTHQPGPGPFQASHAIFIAEDGPARFDAVNRLPPVFAIRLMSLRAFDANAMLIGAELTPGATATAAIERLFADKKVTLIQAHFAKPGCFAANITRA